MKRKIVVLISLSLILLLANGAPSENQGFSLYEEGRSLWDELLKDTSIKNKNLLYASYVAYKDKLNDLSIETFRECIKNNPSNDLIIGISNYYIGKNLFLAGQYQEAIDHFKLASGLDFRAFSDLKFPMMINTAIAYHRLHDLQNFKENLQRVVNDDKDGKYGRIAQGLLSQVK